MVTRAHLKLSIIEKNWDLLDLLLETDNTLINDNALFTDTWGEWWGMLSECIFKEEVTGVKILLKHGADTSKGTWGDCIPVSPIETADDKPIIKALLCGESVAEYKRKTEPILPVLSEKDKELNKQGDMIKITGLIFNIE